MGMAGDDRLVGGGGNDQLLGGEGSDRLNGGSGSDQLLGNNGNDQLQGNSGNDRLSGGHGQDVLIAGLGRDQLTGGTNADIFVLNQGSGDCIITDFQPQDRLALPTDISFGDLTVRQQAGNTVISLGSNPLATLVNVETLTASSFTSSGAA
jgi:Ca2+-binding RTX toxin-like protein